MLNFCPKCGNKLFGDRFCGSCGEDLTKYMAIEETSSPLDRALEGLIDVVNEKQDKDDKLRALIIMGKYDEARKYCEDLIDKYPMDSAGYIGLIRIASVNYTQAGFGISVESEVEKQIRIATEILGEEALLSDKDFADYLARFPRTPEKQCEHGEKCFEHGDFGAAKDWFQVAARKGHAYSKFMLGKLYEEGKGVEKNLKYAMDMYTQAAEAGDQAAIAYFNPVEPEAQYKLGLNFYLTGNLDGAKWWFEQAGNNNYNIAVYYLGSMHEEGKGFAKDIDKAYELYSSVKMGCQEAWDAVERIDRCRKEEERKRLEQKKAEEEQKRFWQEKAEAARRDYEAAKRKLPSADFEFDGCSIKLKGYRDKNATSVVIPDGVTDIGERAFSEMERLTTVTLPKSLFSIGYESFSECGRLSGITLPDGLKIIENLAFYNCARISYIDIPNSVQRIGPGAFEGCGITSVTVPYDCIYMHSSYIGGEKNISAFPDDCIVRRGW